ncbi:hypothetical protein CSB11_00325 [Candidatus Campbellbacteria bacterium]|nr:MAG: hypothetical protein CSB11_00325 [Candidatus Campbellbacteria bacterium]
MDKQKIAKLLLFAIPVVLLAGFMYSMKNTQNLKNEIVDISEKTKIENKNNSKIENIDEVKKVKEEIEKKEKEIKNKKVGAEKKVKEESEKKNIEKNNKKENMETGKVYTTESGLKYEVLKLGGGNKPQITDTVEVHYHGTLEDGTVFDSSVQRGEKISFPLNQVILGWQEGLQLMPVGSKFKFTIPAELAYGQQALPGIPAESTLIFEVELFDIK